MKYNTLYNGNCFDLITEVDDNSIDLIVTSPPYADQRKATYGGVHPDAYVDWFLPLSEQMFKKLKPIGSLVINIKEKVVDGQRHTYVMELVIAMKKQGWLWTEEYCWHKRNSFPGKWPNRLRDGWERCLHFTRQKTFSMYQDAVKIPIGGWAKQRMKHLSDNDSRRFDTQNGSGFGKNIANWLDKDLVLPNNVIETDVMLTAESISYDDLDWEAMNDELPSNVLHYATECSNRNHSAAFPEALPTFFIKLFTKAGDLVLDPFMGSGTVAVVSRDLKRDYIGFELSKEYHQVSERRLHPNEATSPWWADGAIETI